MQVFVSLIHGQRASAMKGGVDMSQPRPERERQDNDDPYEGLTTKEAAKLKARLGEDLGIVVDRENMTGREKLYEMFEDPGSSFGAVVVSTIINCMILLSTTTFGPGHPRAVKRP